MPKDRDPAFERRLDELRQEARSQGRVEGRGVDIAGSPLPVAAVKNGRNGHGRNGLERAVQSDADKPGYFGMPALKPPVWTWEVPVYFFIGGATGMAAVIALAATCFGHPEIVRAAMWIAAFGGVTSPVLLIMDLGRPLLFFNMLRVFKLRSAMSMGVYILAPFGMTSIPGALAVEIHQRGWLAEYALLQTLLGIAAIALTALAGLSGMLLATYTGVLIGATAVPAWNRHRSLLPLHFGTAGLGSAVSVLHLCGYVLRPLVLIFWVTVIIETFLWLWLMFRRHGKADRALHEGLGGHLLMPAELLDGPISLALITFGFPGIASVGFLLGSVLSRFGWVQAGKQSATDPEAALLRKARRATGKSLNLRSFGAWLLLCAIWSSTWIFIKLGLNDLPPVWFACIRFVIASAALVIFNLFRGASWPRRRQDWLLIAATGVMIFAVNYGLLFWAEQRISPGLSAVLQATIPAFGLLFAHLYLPSERLTLLKVGGVAVGLLGVGVVCSDQLSLAGTQALWGSVAIVVGAASAAYANVLVKAYGQDLDPAVMATGQMCCGWLPLMALGFWTEGNPFRLHWTGQATFDLFYLALVGSSLAFFILYWLVRRVEVTKILLISLVTPMAAVIIDALVLKVLPSPRSMLGGVCVLAGMGLVIYRRAAAPAPEANVA